MPTPLSLLNLRSNVFLFCTSDRLDVILQVLDLEDRLARQEISMRLNILEQSSKRIHAVLALKTPHIDLPPDAYHLADEKPAI